jgi:excinuclease UvrABC helicase subunit UvrB
MSIITFPESPYRLHQPFEPAGDQPTAIAQLGRPAIVMAPNKTLVA